MLLGESKLWPIKRGGDRETRLISTISVDFSRFLGISGMFFGNSSPPAIIMMKFFLLRENENCRKCALSRRNRWQTDKHTQTKTHTEP